MVSESIVGEIEIGRRRPIGGETGGGFIYLAGDALNDGVRFFVDTTVKFSNTLETGVQLELDAIVQILWKLASN